MNIRQLLAPLLGLGLALPAAAEPPTGIFLPEIRVENHQIVLTALSSGCTKKEDFRIQFSEPMSLTVTRLRQDRCRAVPRPKAFRYSFEELGLPEKPRFF